MGYESKVIFKAVMDVLSTSDTLEEAMDRIAEIANVEDVIVNPKKRKDSDDTKN